MLIGDIIKVLNHFAPPSLQEEYDNCGLQAGNASVEAKGALTTIDVTEEVVQDAITLGCNLIIAHHPLIFAPLKKIESNSQIGRALSLAFKKDIAIFAIHTNLDNVKNGVSGMMAEKIGLTNNTVLSPKPQTLLKLTTFVPIENTEALLNKLFESGAGQIGNYSECSFLVDGTGSFKANKDSHPYKGEIDIRHHEKETKIEVILPAHIKSQVLSALLYYHPYEEVAYDIYSLENEYAGYGSGIIGSLPRSQTEKSFLELLSSTFGLEYVKHSPLLNKPIKKVALCGGAGASFIKRAIEEKADVFVTSDVKYHDYFEADGKIVIADIGHWESEQFTADLLCNIVTTAFPAFNCHKSRVKTNPVHFYNPKKQ